MANKVDSIFTAQVKTLLDKLYGRSVLKDSLLERAQQFYENQPFNESKLDKLQQRIAELSTEKENDKARKQIDKIERDLRNFKQELKDESDERCQFLQVLCNDIIELSEGSTFAESCRKSAKFLGTIQLLSPTEGSRVADSNERSKPLYKAVLTLRLLDQLCIDESPVVANDFLQSVLGNASGEHFKNLKTIDADTYQAFLSDVKVPILMASLLQDIGHYHPEAQAIVCGEDGSLDPYRTIKVDERKNLLQINYRETLKFLIEGIGAPTYIGNSKTERDRFNIREHKKLVFIKQLLKSAIAPRNGIGNVIKVPQIYASIILSTKSSYNYKLLPKVYQALFQNAEKGTCDKTVVETLRSITGDYPQGYGITYIPYEEDGKRVEHYEYAIVTQLYPKQPDHPICRTATRGLTFIGHGQDLEIKPSVNLYNTEVAQAFARLSKDRLNEILERLSSNYLERKQLDLLPRCWHAHDYFGMKDNQKLWNKSS